MLRILISYVLILIGVNTIQSQQVQYLNVTEGLSSRHTYGIEQDQKGFMWFATNEGIDRFDGLEFRNYKLYNSAIMPTDLGYRFNITLDSSNVIWAYTTTGKIYRFNQNKDDFEQIIDLKTSLGSKWAPYVHILHFDRNNNLLIGSSLGVYIAKINGVELESIRFYAAFICFAFEESGQGFIWAGTNDGVKIISNDRTKTDLSKSNPVCTVTKGFRVRSLLCDSLNKKLWIGTDDNGPSAFEFSQNKLIDLNFLTPHIPIRCIRKDLLNNVLFGLDGAGITIIDPISFKIKNIWNENEDDLERLADNSVLDIYCDTDNRIWVSTWSEGITILDRHKPRMEFIRHRLNTDNSLRSNQVNSILEDSDGDLWFGTNTGVSVYHQNTNKWDHLKNIINAEKISNYKILTITEDDRKRIWIGGYGNGVHCYDKRLRTLTDYTQKVGMNYIYSILFDKTGNLWFGGMDAKITSMNLNTDQFSHFELNNVTIIINKNHDQLWVGCTSGLFVMNKKTGRATYYTQMLSDSIFLSNNYINYLYQGNDERLFVGTNGGGLNYLDVKKKSIEVYSIEHGLPSNFIYGVLSDENNRIWMSTEKGISCFDPVLRKSVNIGNIQGITNYSFNRNAQFKLTSGKIIFGGTSGAVLFSPETMKSYIGKSHLVLDEFRLAYRKVLPGDENSPLEHPIDELTEINLKHNQNSFSFKFSSINFDNANQFAYQWKLKGFDSEWAPLTSSRTAGYTNIPYGNYTFIIRCINRNDLLISDERSIRLSISPPFWETKPAMFIYFIILVGIVFVFYKMQQNRLEKKHSTDKIRFFINTAHDIKTPVSLLVAPLKNLESENGLSKNGLYYLKLAQSNAHRLSTMVNQILDFDKIDSRKSPLVLSYINLNAYLHEKISLFQLMADDKQIALIHNIPNEEINVDFDLEKLDNILDNLFSNAIKYTPKSGQVELTLGLNEKDWILTLTDTGIGIPRKDQKNLFNMYYRAENAINSRKPGSGLGLIMVQNLVKMHGGKITLNSQEDIGSTFTLTFPINNKKHLESARIDFESQHAEKFENKPVVWYEKLQSKISQNPKTQLKILVVEDDDELRDYLSCSLSSDYFITEAQDGQIAYDLIQKEKYDLIISDVMMPSMRGDELCRIIKTNIDTSHIPVILLTALADKKNTLLGLEAGADNYVNKPFDIEVIKARINNILYNRQLIKETLLKGIEPNSDKVHINNIDKSIIKTILAIVEKELSNTEFSITDLCREAAMSRTLLYEKIKVHTGLAPNEFIRIIRLNKAMDLLKSGEYSINEIAFKVGFQDSKYFSTSFKKFFGKSPKEFKS
jgi:signal transduction histidine kinase/DNA-binding response OmpR family regulator/ligand-binding sensor domain-containing protein